MWGQDGRGSSFLYPCKCLNSSPSRSTQTHPSSSSSLPKAFCKSGFLSATFRLLQAHGISWLSAKLSLPWKLAALSQVHLTGQPSQASPLFSNRAGNSDLCAIIPSPLLLRAGRTDLKSPRSIPFMTGTWLVKFKKSRIWIFFGMGYAMLILSLKSNSNCQIKKKWVNRQQ